MADAVKRTCETKHTKYQPTDEEFHCPKCGAKVGDFYKDDPVGEEDCDLLHDEDNLSCANCGYGCSGRALVARIIKAKGLVQCPCCKGAGMVKKEADTLVDRLARKAKECREAAKQHPEFASQYLPIAVAIENALSGAEV